jgi:hypothetical protein
MAMTLTRLEPITFGFEDETNLDEQRLFTGVTI